MTNRLGALQARMLAHGFVITHTGGNCFCYVREDAAGEIAEVVTVWDGASLPERQRDKVCIGTYTASAWNEGGEESEKLEGFTLGDVLAALDYRPHHSHDAYYLLSLKLHNRFHKL